MTCVLKKQLINICCLSKPGIARYMTSCISKTSSAATSLKARTSLTRNHQVLSLCEPSACYVPMSYCKTWTQRQKPPAQKRENSKDFARQQMSGMRIEEGPNKYQPRSPYKIATPKSYGYHEDIWQGGTLPRTDKPIRQIKEYKAKDRWDAKHALFGQNDYIDILGSTEVHPVDLVKGPKWLVGVKDKSELHRLVRRMKMVGGKLRMYKPKKHEEMNKRIRYLYYKYNRRRGNKV